MNEASGSGDWRVETVGPEETRTLASALGEILRAADWIGLSGDLGAGKTCFVQGAALGAGVSSAQAVTSPTFTILQSYEGRLPLHHLDLYRVESHDELVEIGYDELLEGSGACMVEWWDRIPQAQPAEGLQVSIALEDEVRRVIVIQAFGERGRDLLARWRNSWNEEEEP